MSNKKLIVIGAGITGLWQAWFLARAGHNVTLIEASPETAPFSASASILAGAMLAPFCEAETAEPVVHELGVKAMAIWLEQFPEIVKKGSLVVAHHRDQAELIRFARLTSGHKSIDRKELRVLEPALAARFSTGLYFPQEAHMEPDAIMSLLLARCRRLGVDIRFGQPWQDDGRNTDLADTNYDYIFDCRGMAAREDLPDLRAVRGERVIVRSAEITLNRPVRLLHPRHPLYVVPWPETNALAARSRKHDDGQLFMIGSTLLESDDDSAMTVRSALEMLGMAYALLPAFGEAEIIDMAAGIRPAFPDNIPKIVRRGRHIHVNGMYRHGFLLAPELARQASEFIDGGSIHASLFIDRTS